MPSPCTRGSSIWKVEHFYLVRCRSHSAIGWISYSRHRCIGRNEILKFVKKGNAEYRIIEQTAIAPVLNSISIEVGEG
jgi:hypothetical protein